MSSRTVVRWSLAAALAATGFIAVGCEDADAAARAEAETTLVELSDALKLVSLTSNAGVAGDSLRNALEKIARDAAAVRDGTDGQQAAAALIGATAHRQLAELHAAHDASVEAGAGRLRSAAMARIRAADRVDQLASAIENVDAETARQRIAAGIAAVEADVAIAADSVAELDGPIADLRRLNEGDRTQATRLNREANDLRVDARAAGYAAGLPSYRRAIELEREASGFEYQVAARQNELVNRFEPEYRLGDLSITRGQAAVAELQSALSTLRNFDNEMGAASRSMRQAVAGLKTSIMADLAAADPTTGRESRDAAVAQAQAAAAQAQAASRGDRRASVAASARAKLLEARVLTGRANALLDQAAVLAAAAEVPSLGVASRDVTAARSAAAEAVTEAMAVIDAVIEAASGGEELSSVAGAAAQLKAGLEANGG